MTSRDGVVQPAEVGAGMCRSSTFGVHMAIRRTLGGGGWVATLEIIAIVTHVSPDATYNNRDQYERLE